MLTEEYPQHKFNGIEPFGEGFLNLKELNAVVRKLGVNLSIESYEDHQSKYDLIYCVNVFEHVKDWRHFLNWASNNLKENGLFLCSVPIMISHEPHFRIPITFNKGFTFRVFEKHIRNFEKNSKYYGLWNSLNLSKREMLHTVRIMSESGCL